jgi:hypothetical protein
MAGTYAPTITVQAEPFISVTTTDLTPYSEIQETQGAISYQATELYYQADTIEQINAPIIVQQYDADGVLNNESRINVANPNQFQTSKNIDLKSEPITFDGRTRINVELFPNENLKLYFQTQRVESSDFLKGGKKFFSQDFLKTYGFFEQYDSEIKGDIDDMDKQLNKEIECDE